VPVFPNRKQNFTAARCSRQSAIAKNATSTQNNFRENIQTSRSEPSPTRVLGILTGERLLYTLLTAKPCTTKTSPPTTSVRFLSVSSRTRARVYVINTIARIVFLSLLTKIISIEINRAVISTYLRAICRRIMYTRKVRCFYPSLRMRLGIRTRIK